MPRCCRDGDGDAAPFSDDAGDVSDLGDGFDLDLDESSKQPPDTHPGSRSGSSGGSSSSRGPPLSVCKLPKELARPHASFEVLVE